MKTQIFCVRPGHVRRLMNTISVGSRFHSIPRTCADTFRMDLSVNQLSVAREIAQAWHRNGPWPDAKYEIEQDGELVPMYAA
jgi:hypothetical protein